MLLSVGSIVVLSLINARQEVVRGLATEFDLIVGGVTDRISEQLTLIANKHQQMANWIRADPQIADDNARMAIMLRAGATGSSQTTAVAFVRADRTSVRFDQASNTTLLNDLGKVPAVVAVLKEAEARGPAGRGLSWSAPLFSESLGRTIIVHRKAVWVRGQFLGLLFSAMDLTVLSKYVSDLSATIGSTVFILYGRGEVLAHPSLTLNAVELSVEKPLPRIADIPDDRLQLIWQDGRQPVISQDQMKRSEGHYLVHDGQWQVFVYGDAGRYGDKPWLVGFHFDTSSRGSQVLRFWLSAIVGAVLLILFTLIGLWLGKRTARPIQQLVDTANAVEQLEFAKIKPLPRSPIYELDRAATALNRMITGLQVFERYVPKPLVRGLIRQGEQSVQPQERVVTVMFTDIVGFSSIAEKLTPRQTAELLNRHFAMLGECVEASGGTIDKYIGDGSLAFWGAPEPVDDHAARACQTALLIAKSMARHRKVAEEFGVSGIGVRIGIHTGAAIVGDIGGEQRTNYTVIGDTVNIANRLEDYARNFHQGDVTIVVSEMTRKRAEELFEFQSLGTLVPLGRAGNIGVSRLISDRDRKEEAE